MQQKFAVPLTLLVLLLGACNSAPIEVLPLSSPADSPLPTATSLPSMTPTLTPTKTPTSTVAPAPTPVPTFTAAPSPSVTPEGVTPPAGVIYRRFDGIWRIEANGQAKQLFDQSVRAAVSPDGSRILYVQADPERDTLWLVDSETGQQRKLIEGFDGTLCCPIWWPTRPDWVMLNSWPRGKELPESLGYLTAARLDGKEYRILDQQYASVGSPAPSPDGQTIAYDGGGPQLYQWDIGPELFDPEQYSLQGVKRIASPAWSPDGKRLAWYVGGDFGRGWQVGIAIFKLDSQMAQLFHVYTNVGHGGWLAAPSWSPDGRWLAFDVEDERPEERGVWVALMTGEERIEHKVGRGVYRWSPDGMRMIVGHSLVEVGTWRSQQIALPPDAEVIGWVERSQ